MQSVDDPEVWLREVLRRFSRKQDFGAWHSSSTLSAFRRRPNPRGVCGVIPPLGRYRVSVRAKQLRNREPLLTFLKSEKWAGRLPPLPREKPRRVTTFEARKWRVSECAILCVQPIGRRVQPLKSLRSLGRRNALHCGIVRILFSNPTFPLTSLTPQRMSL